jgi:hypothetical protein
MATASRTDKIDALMENASVALAATRYFEAERAAAAALEQALHAKDFGRMARIVMPLQEARRQRLQAALDVGRVTVLDTLPVEGARIEPGCYLVQPPLVGADARRLRLAAFEQEVPVAVVCREPATQLRLCPIVAIAPGMTLRTKIDPPPNPDAPDLEWFVGAMEAIGDEAVESIDPGLPLHRRLELVLGRLDAIPDHEGLHHALESICREAERESADLGARRPPRNKKRT